MTERRNQPARGCCRNKRKKKRTASIAQLVERPLSEGEVVGSNHAAAPYQRCKNGTSSSLADARIKGVVLGR